MKTIKLHLRSLDDKELLKDGKRHSQWSGSTWHEVFEKIDRPSIWNEICHETDENVDTCGYPVFEWMTEDEVKEELRVHYPMCRLIEDDK